LTTEIIDQLKQHITEDLFKAQRIISSNMLLLESIQIIDTDNVQKEYDVLMAAVDEFGDKVKQLTQGDGRYSNERAIID